MDDQFYGMGPVSLGPLDLSSVWHEFMDVLYMPVRIPRFDLLSKTRSYWLPPNLDFMSGAIHKAWVDAQSQVDHLDDPYIYVTARRGYATEGHPLNRPGWHTDDFGGTDLNYIWTDRCATQFLLFDTPQEMPAGEAESLERMAYLADYGYKNIADGEVDTLYRLTPYVIHSAPEIIEEGMRSFFKISVSDKRYDLIGNAHNYGLDYEWPMRERDIDRNPTSQKGAM